MPKKVVIEARREEIAEAVWRLLASAGAEGVTMRRVAKEAGLSIGALPYYFDSKDDLISFALKLAYDRAAERVEAAALKEPAAEALRQVVMEDLPLDPARQSESHVWLSFWSRAAIDPELAGDHAARYEEWRGFLSELLRKGQTDGSIRQDLDPDIQADLLVAILDGLSIEALVEPDRLDAKRLTALLDAHLGGLGAPSSSRDIE